MPSGHILRVTRGPDAGRIYPIAHFPVLFGSGAEADVRLTADDIAPAHAVLEEEGDVMLLRDLGGGGGTTVNGDPVVIEMVKPGDVLGFGGTLVQFWVHGEGIRQATPVPLRDLDVNTAPDTSVRSISSLYLPAEADQEVQFSLTGEELSALRLRPKGDGDAEPERVDWAFRSLDALHQITEVLGHTFDLESLLERVLDIVLFTVGGDRGVVLLTEGGIDGNTVRVARRHPGQARSGDVANLRVSRTIAQRVITEGRALLTTDAAADERFNAGESVLSLNIRSAMCAPLRGRQEVLGIIHVDAGDRAVFTEPSLRLLATIADMAGKVVENARLYEASLEAERLAAVGETVAGTAHYMKNLLTGLMAGAELVDLGLETDDDDCIQTGWAPIRRNLDTLSDLVLNMLDFSKDRVPNVRDLDVRELLSDLDTLIRARAEGRHIQLLVEIGDGVTTVRADPVGAHRAVLNLLTNALDAIPEKGPGRIVMGAHLHGADRVALFVSDTGEGIPADVLPNIFDIFCTTKGNRGTGFGLAVTRKLVEEHGGTIEVDTEVGKGTTFRLVLPR